MLRFSSRRWSFNRLSFQLFQVHCTGCFGQTTCWRCCYFTDWHHRICSLAIQSATKEIQGWIYGRGGQGCAPLLALAKGGCAKFTVTIIAVNVHYYKYSILKREIKRRLNINQKHSNIDKELILSYKVTSRLVIK